jgi:hypothetical protein
MEEMLIAGVRQSTLTGCLDGSKYNGTSSLVLFTVK